MSDDNEGPELPPSVPSQPFDELFSLAYRFRCPGNLPGIDGLAFALKRARCGEPHRPKLAPRVRTTVCFGVQRYTQPFPLKRLCPTTHKATKFTRLKYYGNCGRVKRYSGPVPGAKLCKMKHLVENTRLKRFHFNMIPCKVRPQNTEWPMHRVIDCATQHRAIARKFVMTAPHYSKMGCRTYAPRSLVMQQLCKIPKKFHFAPGIARITPSFLCYSSQKINDATVINTGYAARLCQKYFKPNFVVDHQTLWTRSLSCSVTGKLVIGSIQRPCVPLFNRALLTTTVDADGTKHAPLYKVGKPAGMCHRLYPVAVLNTAAKRSFCNISHHTSNTAKTFAFRTRPLHNAFCARVFPLQSSFKNERAICGTIVLADAPILIFGRVWGGQGLIGVTPPTSGRVGGERFRNSNK